jgi:hypothetical protein
VVENLPANTDIDIPLNEETYQIMWASFEVHRFIKRGLDFLTWEQVFGVGDFGGLGAGRGRCFGGGFL